MRRALEYVIDLDFKNSFINFQWTYNLLPTDEFILINIKFEELLSLASKSLSTVTLSSDSKFFYFIYGTIKLLNKEYALACEILGLNLTHRDALSFYMLSKGLYLNNSPSKALNAIEKSLDILPSTRSYYQKAIIFDPYTSLFKEDNIANKSIYIESILFSLMINTWNSSAYKALLQFTEKEGLQLKIPNIEIYLFEIKKTRIDSDFTGKIRLLIQKNKFKLLKASVSITDEDLTDGNFLEEYKFDEEFDYCISEQELMEDSLDDFHDSEDYY